MRSGPRSRPRQGGQQLSRVKVCEVLRRRRLPSTIKSCGRPCSSSYASTGASAAAGSRQIRMSRVDIGMSYTSLAGWDPSAGAADRGEVLSGECMAELRGDVGPDVLFTAYLFGVLALTGGNRVGCRRGRRAPAGLS